MKFAGSRWKNPKRAAVAMVVLLLQVAGDAFAHEGMDHDKGHTADARMQKLHELMPMYAQAATRIDVALTRKDAAAIRAETGKILATITDLTNAKPHKNLKKMQHFRKISTTFAGDLKKTASLAEAGDFGGAKEAFRLARMRCDQCHKGFRD